MSCHVVSCYHTLVVWSRRALRTVCLGSWEQIWCHVSPRFPVEMENFGTACPPTEHKWPLRPLSCRPPRTIFISVFYNRDLNFSWFLDLLWNSFLSWFLKIHVALFSLRLTRSYVTHNAVRLTSIHEIRIGPFLSLRVRGKTLMCQCLSFASKKWSRSLVDGSVRLHSVSI